MTLPPTRCDNIPFYPEVSNGGGDDADMEMEAMTESAPGRDPRCQVRQQVAPAGGCAPAHGRCPPHRGADSANGSMMAGEAATSVTASGANLLLQSTADTDPTNSHDIATPGAPAILMMTVAPVGRGPRLHRTKGQRRKERARRLQLKLSRDLVLGLVPYLNTI